MKFRNNIILKSIVCVIVVGGLGLGCATLSKSNELNPTTYIEKIIFDHDEFKNELNKHLNELRLIKIHKGSEELEITRVQHTIDHTLNEIPNINNTEHMKKLVLETFIVETNLGKANYHKAQTKYNNYGIAQFRLQSAKETLERLKKRNPDGYKVLMRFYDNTKDLKYNLLYNVPFCIGLTASYYEQRSKLKNIDTLLGRAQTWKQVYNTRKGLGTVKGYQNKVNKNINM